jgi:hypothetical protein
MQKKKILISTQTKMILFFLKNTKIFRPRVISRRISAQAGVFTNHYLNKNGNFFKFETLKNYKDKLTKIIIPANKFKEIRKELNTMGINNFVVFPDLEGFCKHLERRFSKFEDE